MAHETDVLWIVFLGIGAAVLGVVVLLLGLLRESVKSLGGLVAQVWSSAVGVFGHTVTAARSSTGRRSRSAPCGSGHDGPAGHPDRGGRRSLVAVVVGYVRVFGGMVGTIEETLADKVAGARHVAGHLPATSSAAAGLESELDALLRR